ncbi:MAG: zinc ribbon domain-containing protein, partial [Planctomycetota bacterium]
MSDPNASLTSSAVVCGACQATNESTATFCSSCGQPLFEPCHECAKPVRIGQRFCGHCGSNLQKAIDERVSKSEALIAKAVEYAKDLEFSQSIDLLVRVAAMEDYRFKEVRETASQALDKVREVEARQTELARQCERRSQPEIEAENHPRVCSILSKAPFKLL